MNSASSSRFVLFLRSASYLVILAGTIIPCAAVILFWFWGSYRQRYGLGLAWARWINTVFNRLCQVRVDVIGIENLPDQAAIVLPKHQSAWETLWLPTRLPRPLSYVFKHQLDFVPFFGWALSSLGMIRVNRSKGSASEQVIAQAIPNLQQGRWVVIFPEGTRTAPGAHPRYKTGGARLAISARVPVIPIALNSGERWARRAFIKTPGVITVSIGPAIYPDGLSPEALTAQVESWIETEMRRLSPHRY
jgi:1-acyl-sn-glycerol-3-phosphate acyltransferase